MASIIQKNNSPFYYVKYYENGMPKEHSTKSRNYKVAQRIRNEIEDRITLGRFDLIPASSSVPVDEFRKEFFETKGRDMRESSVDRYRRSINQFLSFYPEVKNMKQFTYRHINDYLNKRKQDGLEQSSLCNELRAIKVFFNLCNKLYKIPSPARDIRLNKPSRKAPNIYSQDEIRKILSVRALKDRAVLLLDLQTGLRKGEMASRKWKHIDFEKDIIWVLSEKEFVPKDKESRQVPLRKETKEALLNWHKESRFNNEDDYIFYSRGKQGITHFDRFMLNVLAKAGVKGSCQKFRDTFASYSLACGVPPQNVREWLGHSSLKVTDKYSNYLPKAVESDIRRLFEWR